MSLTFPCRPISKMIAMESILLIILYYGLYPVYAHPFFRGSEGIIESDEIYVPDKKFQEQFQRDLLLGIDKTLYPHMILAALIALAMFVGSLVWCKTLYDQRNEPTEEEKIEIKRTTLRQHFTTTKALKTKERPISCPICHDEYQEDDQIAFSDNDECKHHFHTDCIMEWMMKGNDDCPMCRNIYVHIESLGCYK